MASRLLLSRAAAIALRALVELAREPGATLSVAELARRQQLPQPMLEQVLLRLRRAGLVQARRGRQGGYQLALKAENLPLERVLRAVERPRGAWPGQRGSALTARPGEGWCQVAAPAVSSPSVSPSGGRPQRSPEVAGSPAGASGGGDREPSGHPLARGLPEDGCQPWEGEEAPGSLGASAGHRVEQQLRSRLERLVQRELQRLTLAELLYDQRSWEASLGPEGGVMLS